MRPFTQPVVLLVEDEPLARLTQVEILREAGFWVLQAQDADEAFDPLRRRQDVRAVLTDVDMPGSLDGFEFSRLVVQGRPEVGVLVISGNKLLDKGDLPPSGRFLAEPVRPEILGERLQSRARCPAGAISEQNPRRSRESWRFSAPEAALASRSVF